MISNVRGEFGKVSGNVVLDPSDLTKSTVEVIVDATTIDTREPQRDEHLRSADFSTWRITRRSHSGRNKSRPPVQADSK